MGLSGISGEFVDTLGTPYRAGLEYLDYMGCISKKEEIELSYLYLEGYRYLTKEQDGEAKLWRNLPKRFKLAKGRCKKEYRMKGIGVALHTEIITLRSGKMLL